MTNTPQTPAQTPVEFEARLRQIGADLYHDKHPFHIRLHSGGCSMDQVRAWVVNRYYYQTRIPMKDAAFMSRVSDPNLRRIWRSRIEDHDGTAEGEGGIARWLKLARAVGLDPDYVSSEVGIMPATRFAVDAYVRFVRDEPLLPAVASSLTEMFAPQIHRDRIAGLMKHYDFATLEATTYFRQRLNEAPKDVAFGLQWVLDHALTQADQDAAARALVFKTQVLWAQLDALWSAYVEPGHIPPGAWQPADGLLP
ncbi:MAG: pyrroloquinoline quinone biosynthesis protein C [Rhodobacteraceae bacterium]|nr:MAG: pyrroloquinoline quinone biosynthesis protein C [Paracoccaceae bacterium]